MKFIWQYLRKHLTLIVFATFMSIVSGSSLIFIMNIFRIAIKDGIPDVSILFLKVAIALIAYFVFGVYSDKIMFKISHETVMEMRIDL